ncbi:flippase-like domain-containing protein [bacterium]|nr:flippase-like domain-containing protein [bacterium]
MTNTSSEPTPQKKTFIERVKALISVISAWFADHRWASKLATALLVAVPIYFLGRSLVTNWQTLQAAEIQIDWGRMLISLAILLVAFALFPLGTLICFRGLGVRLTYPQAYYGYHASQLGKYLPGRIWIIPGRAVALKRHGVDPLIAGASALIDMYVLIAAGVLVYVPSLFLPGQGSMKQLGLLGLLLCLPLLVSLVFPKLLNWLFSLMLKWMGRGELEIKFAWHHFAGMLVTYLVLWILSGLGLFLLADSFSPLVVGDLTQVVGAMGFSWVLGTVSFLTPAGLGVREGAMGLLLGNLIPAPLPALLAILSRFWWTLADFGSIGLAFALLGRKEKGE